IEARVCPRYDLPRRQGPRQYEAVGPRSQDFRLVRPAPDTNWLGRGVLQSPLACVAHPVSFHCAPQRSERCSGAPEVWLTNMQKAGMLVCWFGRSLLLISSLDALLNFFAR